MMQFKNLLILAFLGTLITFSSCRKDDDSSTDDTTVSVTPIILEGQYNSDITLTNHNENGDDYIATGMVQLYGGVMTIEPGVTIRFEDGTGIVVDIDGGLKAVGTTDERITFKGESTGNDGTWNGIFFESDNPSNQLLYTDIKNAGANAYSTFTVKTAVGVYGKAKLENNNISNSGGNGVTVIYFSEQSDITSFKNNSFTDNNGYPIYTEANQLKNMDITSCTFDGNTQSYVGLYINNSNKDLDGTDNVWSSSDIPYLSTTDINITARLQLNEGVNLLFNSGTSLSTVSYSGNQAALRIEGTEDNPVNISGKENLAGYWKGIHINTNSAENIFDYANISDGGSAPLAGSIASNITIGSSISNDELTLNNCTSTNYDGVCAIYIYDTGSTLTNNSPAIDASDVCP